MATDLLNRVQSVLEQRSLLRHDAHILVAVSGGPDSLCLLHLLWRLRAQGGPTLHVAHLDHRFRGAASAAEAAFVAQTASAWNIPATIDQQDVPAIARATRQNTHAAARTVRYTLLARLAHRQAADAVAVAHQADDQAETVLLHLLHGAGLTGLRGMLPALPWAEWAPQATPAATGPPLLRPLLETTRAEIEAYCIAQHLDPRRDPSNTARRYTRSRLRTELLPALAAYNPHIVAALCRTAQLCADDYAYIQTQLDAIWPELTETGPSAITFAAATWQRLPPALQRAALRRAARQLAPATRPTPSLTYAQIEAARAATRHRVGFQQTLAHGLLLRVEHASFLLIQPAAAPTAAAPATAALPQLAAPTLPLPVPSTTPISPTWCVRTTYLLPGTSPPADPDDLETPSERWRILLDAAALDGPLLLRQRQPGDRFRPAGGPGTRRLQDFFVDHKVPRALRAAWPILATPTSIIWVAGLRADARFQTTANTQQIVWVAFSRISKKARLCTATSTGC